MALVCSQLFMFRSPRAFSSLNNVCAIIRKKSEYQSKYSLGNIYPNSSLNIASLPKIPKNIEDTFSGYIPIDELKITYSRSSGPGGQNVNKVNTKVQVRFHVSSAKWIPEKAKSLILELHKGNITKDGYLIVASDKTRTQTVNLADCIDKIRCLVREATKPPPEVLPETRLLWRQRQEKAAIARVREKRERSSIKQGRQVPEVYD